MRNCILQLSMTIQPPQVRQKLDKMMEFLQEIQLARYQQRINTTLTEEEEDVLMDALILLYNLTQEIIDKDYPPTPGR